MKQRLILAAGVIIIFAAGLYVGEMRAQKGASAPQTGTTSGSAQSPKILDDTSIGTKPPAAGAFSSPNASHESQASHRVAMAILQAFGKPKPERTAELLTALEELTKVPLTKELLDTLRQILDGGEIDEADYVFSLMEQREEKSSVAFLAQSLDHPQKDVRDRALMACEAVAGTIFTDHAAAKIWSQSWKPNPAVAELFSPNSSLPETSTSPHSQSGPMGAALRQSETNKLSPAQNPPQKETPEN